MATPKVQHEDIWRDLLYAQRSMLMRLTARLKRDFDLTTAQYEALSILRTSPGRTLPATVLASRMLYSSGSASHLFSRLEERGLVQRSPSPSDARMVMVTLTPTGLRLARAAGAAHREDLEREFAPLLEGHDAQALQAFARQWFVSEGLDAQPNPQ